MKRSCVFLAACVVAVQVTSCITKGDNTIIAGGSSSTETDTPDASVSTGETNERTEDLSPVTPSPDGMLSVVNPGPVTSGPDEDQTEASTADDITDTEDGSTEDSDEGSDPDESGPEEPDAAVVPEDTEDPGPEDTETFMSEDPGTDMSEDPGTEATEDEPFTDEPLLANGAICSSASECASNHCEETISGGRVCCQDSCGPGLACDGSGECNPHNPFGNVLGGSAGQTSRYWDCCKPYCAGSEYTTAPVDTCDAAGENLGVSEETSACSGGSGSMCGHYAPWAMNELVAFGYAAVAAPSSGNLCEKCYQLQFTGSSSSGPDSGSERLVGKTMIVRGIHFAGDLPPSSFELLIPGGGTGAFNACTVQWGTMDIGENLGGFRQACGNQTTHANRKSCVRNYCENVFVNRADLLASCLWFVDWFEVADNPSMFYKEISCPPELQ